MSEKNKKADGAEGGKQKKEPIPFTLKFAFFSIFVAGAVFFPTTVVFLACMAPTFVAAIVDREPQRTLWITIGAVNLAGTVPAWFALWSQGHSIDTALLLVTSPMTLATAYGGAGVGWVIYQNITPLVARVMVRKNQKRLKDIEKRQKELMQKWGEDVTRGN